MHKLFYFEEALADLRETTAWIRQHRATGEAERFVADVRRAVAEIAEHPLRYQVKGREPQPFRVRHLHSHRYSIIYLVTETEVRIAAVSHMSRDPEHWLKRLR